MHVGSVWYDLEVVLQHSLHYWLVQNRNTSIKLDDTSYFHSSWYDLEMCLAGPRISTILRSCLKAQTLLFSMTTMQMMLMLYWSFFQPFFYLFLSTAIFFVYVACFFVIILLWFVEFLSDSSYTYRSEICITWCFFRAGWEDTLPFFSQVICNYHSVLCGVKNLSVFLSRLWIMVSFTLIILYM